VCCMIVELTIYLYGGAVSSEPEEAGVVSEIRSPRILAWENEGSMLVFAPLSCQVGRRGVEGVGWDWRVGVGLVRGWVDHTMISSFHVCVRLWSYLDESLRAESHACHGD
jgi:hypothetical protein